MIERPCFFAFWPQYYVDSTHTSSSPPSSPPSSTSSTPGSPTSPNTVCWPPLGPGNEQFVRDFAHECGAIGVFEPGLGVSASPWWGRLNRITRRAVAFHYLSPRAMRHIHSLFAAHNASSAAPLA